MSKKHAKYSMSSTKQFVKCPVSLFLSKDIPGKKASAEADEGTLAHDVAEVYLEAKLKGLAYPSIDMNIYNQEMIDCAVIYCETIYNTIKPFLQYPHDWAIEKTLKVSELYWGTGDFVFVYTIDGITAHLIICDFKYGKNVDVSSEENYQILGYSYGSIASWVDLPVETIHGCIIQPRVVDSHSCFNYTIEEAKKYYSEIDTAISTSESFFDKNGVTEAEYAKHQKAGDHCRWCKAKYICKAYKNKDNTNKVNIISTFSRMKAKAVVDLGLNINEMTSKEEKLLKEKLQDPKFITGVLSEEERAYIQLNKTAIKSEVDAVCDANFGELQAGKKIKGLRLDYKLENRSWLPDEKLVAEGLKKLGIADPIKTKTSLISITEVEKALAKDVKIDHLLGLQNKTAIVVSEDQYSPMDLKSVNSEIIKVFSRKA